MWLKFKLNKRKSKTGRKYLMLIEQASFSNTNSGQFLGYLHYSNRKSYFFTSNVSVIRFEEPFWTSFHDAIKSEWFANLLMKRSGGSLLTSGEKIFQFWIFKVTNIYYFSNQNVFSIHFKKIFNPSVGWVIIKSKPLAILCSILKLPEKIIYILIYARTTECELHSEPLSN